MDMNDYVLLTDSSADLTAEMVRELDLDVLPLSFIMEDKTYQNWPDNRDMDPAEFYQRLRDGAMATTSAINIADYTEKMEPYLKQGKDVLMLAFSSGLSTSCHAGQLAAQDLMEQYPDRKIYVVDTLCASMGQGLLVWYAAKMRQQGKDIEEVKTGV